MRCSISITAGDPRRFFACVPRGTCASICASTTTKESAVMAVSAEENAARINAQEVNLRHLRNTLARQEKLVAETKARIAATEEWLKAMRK